MVGEEFIRKGINNPIDKNYSKKGRGQVATIPFKVFEEVTKSGLESFLKKEAVNHEKKMVTSKKLPLDTSYLNLSSFIYIKKLGEGQFGKVYLVKESESVNKFYAIKCIKKSQVIEHKM